MAKKTPARHQDQFLVRLPDGMRDRIKAKAERAGMSMNEAIVWCLESYFPAPVTLEERLADLANLVSILKTSENTYEGVEDLINEIETTLSDIDEGKVPADPKFRQMVQERFQHWQELQLDEYVDRHESPFDDAKWQNLDEDSPAQK